MLHLSTGQRFGKLTVLRELECVKSGSQSVRQVEVKCECGTTCVARPSLLVQGQKKSCGCLQREVASVSGKLRRKAPGEAAINSVFSAYRLGAKRRKLDFSLSREDLVKLIFSDCRYCGSGPSNIKSQKGMFGAISYNGIDRVDNAKGYAAENCVPCCLTCNKAKMQMAAGEFLDWIKKVSNHIKRHPFIT